jgi:hypothetical protein
MSHPHSSKAPARPRRHQARSAQAIAPCPSLAVRREARRSSPARRHRSALQLGADADFDAEQFGRLEQMARRRIETRQRIARLTLLVALLFTGGTVAGGALIWRGLGPSLSATMGPLGSFCAVALYGITATLIFLLVLRRRSA